MIDLIDDTQDPAGSQSLTFAQTCPNQDPACAFTRTVVGSAQVPEPEILALVGLALGGIGFAGRRRLNG